MTGSNSVAVITVTYNSAETLRRFWSTAEPRDYEWIVVDNASQDGSADIALGLGAKVVALESNLGFSAGNNAGVRETDAELLIFCNPDVAVSSLGVRELAARATALGGVVAPQLLNTDGTPQENGRGAPLVLSKVKHLLRIPDPAYTRTAEPGELIDVVWVMGAAMAIRRSDFTALGGWDEGFFIYYEDADICLRAADAGMTVKVDGSVRWVHGWARETGRGFSWRAWKFELKAAWRFYRKHPDCVLGIGRRRWLLGRDGAPTP